MANWNTQQRQLEEALIRDAADATVLSEELAIDELVPVLSKYAKPVHPHGTRERVLECLESRDEWQAVELLATYLAPTVENRDLRAQAASILSSKDCSCIANEVLGVLTEDLHRLLQIAPVLIGLTNDAADDATASRWLMALEGLRADLASLCELTDDAVSRARSVVDRRSAATRTESDT